MTTEEFRANGHRLIDWIAEYLAGIAERPVLTPSGPSEVKRQLPASPTDNAESFDEIMGDLDRIIVPGLFIGSIPEFSAISHPMRRWQACSEIPSAPASAC